MSSRVYPPPGRLLARCSPEPTTGCWLWTGAYDKDGYGFLSVGNRKTRAHRLAWLTWRGPIQPGLFVCHRCDQPACINPAHLFLGTAADNDADRDRKGRANPARGEQRPNALLRAADVLSIRARYDANCTAADLAREYGVSRQTVWDVLRRRTWKHLGGAAKPTRRPGKVTPEVVAEVARRLAAGEKARLVARALHLAESTVSRARRLPARAGEAA